MGWEEVAVARADVAVEGRVKREDKEEMEPEEEGEVLRGRSSTAWLHSFAERAMAKSVVA